MRPYLLFGMLIVCAFSNFRLDADVVNGSFESPEAPPADFRVDIPDGWSALGNGSTTDILRAGYGGGTASHGSQFVDLIGGAGTFPSGLSQVLRLDAGVYRLSFDYNGGRFQDGTPTIGSVLEYSLGTFVSGSVNVDALNVFANHGPVTPWQTISSNFTVPTAGDYTLTFQTPSGFLAGPYLDNVSVIIPEPSTIAILAFGLFLCGVKSLARQRRSSKV
jgi:hypothetical protein